MASHSWNSNATLAPITCLPPLQQRFAARLKSADPPIRRYLSFLKYDPPKKIAARYTSPHP